MNKKIIQQLQATITDAENNPKEYDYFISSLANAKGILSTILNPIKNPVGGYSVPLNETTVKRAIWNLKNSMENRI